MPYPHITDIAVGIYSHLKSYSADDVFTQLCSEYALIYCELTDQLMSFGSVLYGMKHSEGATEERVTGAALLFTPQHCWRENIQTISETDHHTETDEVKPLLDNRQSSAKTSHPAGNISSDMAICVVATVTTKTTTDSSRVGESSCRYEILWFKPALSSGVQHARASRMEKVKLITGGQREETVENMKKIDLKPGAEHQKTDLGYSAIIKEIRSKAEFRAELSWDDSDDAEWSNF